MFRVIYHPSVPDTVTPDASHYVCYTTPTRAIYWRPRLLTHTSLLFDDATSTGIYREQLYHTWNVQSCISWWWVIYHPKHVENRTKWNIYLTLLHQAGVFHLLLSQGIRDVCQKDEKVTLSSTFTVDADAVINPYPTAFPYGNGMVLHFYQQQESSTTKTVHKVINKGLKTYV